MAPFRWILALAVVALSFASFAKVDITHADGKTIYDFQIEDITFEGKTLEKKDFVQAKLKGVKGYEGILYKKGVAEIPAVRFYVDANESSDVKISFGDRAMEKSLSFTPKQIMPSQESEAKSLDIKREFVQDNAFYSTNTYFPFLHYNVKYAGSVKGVKRQLVTIYPFTYNPASGQYRLKSDFKVEVLNHKVAKKDAPETFAFIVGGEFENNDSLKAYMELKRQLGYTIKTIVIGKDAVTEDDVRARLREIYLDPAYDLTYALIIGDIEHVPSKKAKFLSGARFVTDHYYRAIDLEDYYQDINGPDIGVGRVTIKNDQELNVVMAKFTKYINADFARTDWLESNAWIATDDRYKVAEGSHNYAVDNFFADRGYLGDFPNDPQAGGDKLYAITHKVSDDRVVENIKKGRFLVNYSGHGATTYWAGPHVRQNDVRSFTDPDALPFVISNACITGQFVIEESFAETWIKQPGAAILFWGSMDSSYWDEDDIMEKQMYHGIFDDGNRSFAAITQHGLKAVWKYYGGENRSSYYWETYHMFGDTSIDFRMNPPKPVFTNLPDALPFGMNSLDVKVTDNNGAPVIGARVSIAHLEGEFSAAVYSDENGIATLPMKGALVADHYRVTVYGKDIKTETRDIFISSPDYPFFVVKNFTLNGGDKLTAAPGETVDLGFDVVNVSPVPSTGGKIVLESVSGPATITNKEVQIPAIEGDNRVSLAGLGITVGNPSQEEIVVVNLRWTSNEGESYPVTVSFKVVRPMIEVSLVDFGDPQNPGNGGMAPGEAGQIFVTIRNVGSAPLNNAVLEVSPADAGYDITGTVLIETLAVGESKRVPVGIDVQLGNQSNDDVLGFILNGTSTGKFKELAHTADNSFVVGKYGIVEQELGSVNLPILDKETITLSLKDLGGVESIKDMFVHVKLRHTYIGDLEMHLTHPSGKRVKFRGRTGGSTDDMDLVFGFGGVQAEELEQFDGLISDGEWKLEITDHGGGDEGTLDFVKVWIKGFI